MKSKLITLLLVGEVENGQASRPLDRHRSCRLEIKSRTLDSNVHPSSPELSSTTKLMEEYFQGALRWKEGA